MVELVYGYGDIRSPGCSSVCSSVGLSKDVGCDFVGQYLKFLN